MVKPNAEQREKGLDKSLAWHMTPSVRCDGIGDILAAARQFAEFLAANPVDDEPEMPDPAVSP